MVGRIALSRYTYLGLDPTNHWYFTNVTAEDNELIMRLYLTLATNPGQMSQMSSPLASSNDPLFWPIHAEFNRYLDYIRLEPLYNDFNWTWDGEWLVDAHEGGVYGPGYTETLPFTRFKGMTAPRGGAMYTNEELLRISHPDNKALPYVWEDFEWGPKDDPCTVEDALDGESIRTANEMRLREQPFSTEVLRGRNGWW